MSEKRSIVHDEQLNIEAYQFQGIMQKFPNHFHEHYVIGFIEHGQRRLTCRNQVYEIVPGDLMIFEPHMNHTCEQIGEKPLDYRCLNIPEEVMLATVREICEDIQAELPEFPNPVIVQARQVPALRALHEQIMWQGRMNEDEMSEDEMSEDEMDEDEMDEDAAQLSDVLEKEEEFYFLMEELIRNYAVSMQEKAMEMDERLQKVCSYIDIHYAETVTLEQLGVQCGMNKYVMLRSFSKKYGLTPYQYLLSNRVNRAMELLEAGEEPIEAALQTGFTDQSHFTNAFKRTIGLTPGQVRIRK